MAERRTRVDYEALALQRNALWMGPEVPNAKTRTRWRCRSCGRRWWAIYNSLKQGSGCPLCGIRRRSDTVRTPTEAYYALATERGLRWLGPPVPRTARKTVWECAQGHQWAAAYDKIRYGRRCPVCARRLQAERARGQRHRPEDYHALAAARDLLWCGPEVRHANSKTTWKCKRAGHHWQATYNKINQGRGCPECARVRRADFHRHTSDEYHSLAAGRGFRWLGPLVRAVDKKTWWRCAKSHAWRATYNAVQQGSGCPACADLVNGRRVSVAQRRLGHWLGGRLNFPVRRYRIDVAVRVADIRIAVEFDTWYFHGGRLDMDERRDQALMAEGWRVLRIRSPGHLPGRDELDDAIRQLVAGETRLYITLPGWGVGPVREYRECRERRT